MISWTFWSRHWKGTDSFIHPIHLPHLIINLSFLLPTRLYVHPSDPSECSPVFSTFLPYICSFIFLSFIYLPSSKSISACSLSPCSESSIVLVFQRGIKLVPYSWDALSWEMWVASYSSHDKSISKVLLEPWRKNNSVFRVRKWVENGFTGLTLDWVLRHQLGVCQVVV